MSWISKLYETYNHAISLDLEDGIQIEPYYHKRERCHLEIKIDVNGNFVSAKSLMREVGSKSPKKWIGEDTIIPITPKSLTGRTSGAAPYPLAEKIHYIAGDYPRYKGGKKYYFSEYKDQLDDWCNSKHKHKKADAVYCYISKQNVVKDLVEYGLLYVNSGNNELVNKWNKDISEILGIEKPDIFKLAGEDDQGNLMVRWVVEEKGVSDSTTWQDRSLQDSWLAYQEENNVPEKAHFCQITGERKFVSDTHPKGIISTKDAAGAKLISVPTDTGYYTFQGRFTKPSQSCAISFDVSQKAHNTLRWLIKRQGNLNGDQVIVAWAVSCKETPQPLEFSLDDLDNLDEVLESDSDSIETMLDHTSNFGEQFSLALKKYMNGYRAKLEPTESVIIMGLDSATPGRMAITYYREFMAKEYLDIIEKWHIEFAWFQRLNADKTKELGQHWWISAPSPWNILKACYGDIVKSNDSLKKQVYERILPCIVEGKSIPIDLLKLSINRASNPNSCEHWEWEQNIGVACSLYKGFMERQPNKNNRRTYSMALDINYTSRDYLYGRLLAVAEHIEEMAMFVSKEKSRITNASKLMQKFAERPFSTWNILEQSLIPYQQRLRAKISPLESAYKKLIDDIASLFEVEDFTLDQKLSGEYLLGFHCQRKWLREHKVKDGIWITKDGNEKELESVVEGE